MRALIVIGDLSFAMKTGRQDAIVIPVGDGQSALEMAESVSPDLVILDSSLPGMRPLDLIDKFRRRISNTPILVLNESDNGGSRVDCLKAGADECLRCLPDSAEMVELLQGRFRRGTVKTSNG